MREGCVISGVRRFQLVRRDLVFLVFFPAFFAADFIARFLVAPFVFFVATAGAISSIVVYYLMRPAQTSSL
jgi:uncharacterized membrane protein